jgi:glycosyltransferase involved in cell wall biosynthesis
LRILYIHQHFTTNEGAGATRSYDYARYLVQAGHEVTVVTGVYSRGPFTRATAGLIQTRVIDGIRVVIVNVPYGQEMNFAVRMASFLLFAFLSVVVCLRQGRVDVVLATSTPLTVGIPAVILRWLRWVPYVFEVRDIWPEFAVSMGVLKNPMLIRLAYWGEALFYRHAARVQTISAGMCQSLLDRGLEAAKLTLVPTGVDMSLYQQVAADPSLRRQLGWENRLIAVYAGAHGEANGLEYLVETAAALKQRSDIGLLLVGEGRSKPALQEMVRRRNLSNLVFLDKMPKKRLIGLLADAEVGMLILRDLPDFAIALPNKLFDYLAAGMATIVNFEGEAAEKLRTSGAGLATEASDPSDLARQLVHWAEHRDELARARKAAPELARQYDRKVWAGKLEAILAEVVEEHRLRTRRVGQAR